MKFVSVVAIDQSYEQRNDGWDQMGWYTLATIEALKYHIRFRHMIAVIQ